MRIIALLALITSALVFAASDVGAATMTTAGRMTTLSDSSALGTSTIYTTDGSMTSSVAIDTAASTAAVGSDGYLCGNVQYRATVREYDLVGFVVWTYRSTFGVHVCHNKVGYKTALYDEPMDSNFGWNWCGNIVKQFSMNPNNASAIGYTKGCFTVLYKVVQTKYPWAQMTIGGNGGLWVRKTGGA